ncbi:hypothetical protein LZ30DRAFT_66238 [Colletotrichum cereale]|nr:hypothetical protein LZ30DRAFT_66238 [Colletotrichum cereale]
MRRRLESGLRLAHDHAANPGTSFLLYGSESQRGETELEPGSKGPWKTDDITSKGSLELAKPRGLFYGVLRQNHHHRTWCLLYNVVRLSMPLGQLRADEQGRARQAFPGTGSIPGTLMRWCTGGTRTVGNPNGERESRARLSFLSLLLAHSSFAFDHARD